MSPVNRGNRARIMVKIQRLSSHLGAMERQVVAATPNARPMLEVGCNAIREELSNLSRMLR